MAWLNEIVQLLLTLIIGVVVRLRRDGIELQEEMANKPEDGCGVYYGQSQERTLLRRRRRRPQCLLPVPAATAAVQAGCYTTPSRRPRRR